MIRDVTLKLLLIPLLGLLLPLITGVLVIEAHSELSLLASVLYYMLLSFIVWRLTIVIAGFIRRSKTALKNVFYKLSMLFFFVGIVITVVAGIFLLVWQKFFLGSYQKSPVLTFSLSYSGTALFVGLVYEVLFLHKEVELDSKIVDQLDLERQYAEMHVLKNELDPHFIFNSLTALSHLISHDSKKAQLFNDRLAQVYKYLLVNKDRDLITLEEELRFIKDYFFLLQIRYEDKLKLKINIENAKAQQMMILPCALQLLVENAIKHNGFSEENPLHIHIYLNRNQLYITNNIVGKNCKVASTQIGLKNLSNRYRLVCREDIIINITHDNFLVKLPLIKTTVV